MELQGSFIKKLIHKYLKNSQNKINSKVHKKTPANNIRFLTYQSTKQSVAIKWIKTDDSVFDDLAEYVIEEDKYKISDFLNLYYYFIICYSKTCYKRTANWHDNYRYYKYRGKMYKHFSSAFDYNLANETHSHQVLLKIQGEMFNIRKKYKLDDIARNNFWDFDTVKFIMEFINQSLYYLCNIIADPVLLLSNDIKTKIEKYKHLKPFKTSSKCDFNALNKIIGPFNPLENSTHNMIEVCLGSSYIYESC